MRDIREKLLKKLEIIKGENISRMEMEIQLKRAAEAANQKREDKLRVSIVEALQKKINDSEQAQLAQSQARLMKTSKQLQEKIDATEKKVKADYKAELDKQKEKLQKEITKVKTSLEKKIN